MKPLGKGLSVVNGISKYLRARITLTKSENIEAIKTGLLLIGDLNFINENEFNEAFEKLCEFADIKYGDINYQATYGLLALTKNNDDKAAKKILELSTFSNIEFQYPIVDFIWRNDKEAETSRWFEEIAFNLLKHPTEHKGFIHYIEWYIENKFTKGSKDYAYKLLEEWLINGQDITILEDFLNRIALLDFPLFCLNLTNWFLSSEINLLRSLLPITSINFHNELRLNTEVLNQVDEIKVYKILCGVIGFVYTKDALATLTLSILDSKHCEAFANEVNEIFYDYICYTYPSTLNDYIKPQLKISNGFKKKTVKYIIKNVDHYYDTIKKLPLLLEFSGTDKRVENYNKALGKKQKESMDKANEKSFMSQFATNILLKAGPIWFSKIDGKYSTESQLGHFEMSYDLPRAEYIDPAFFHYYRINMKLQALKG